ncbi:hypothetical protein FGO68_gene14401 [Halteria grandinella]|uniref:t-SNARE coiled-coil homology domain-containing protein n=1 Tax=Halteria grandinella TaxID=5974 RepID=A0A8J8NKP4_HALGN|nr:hypothetical protein FGO68_gene14401 [Halteria grandinella]
MAQVTQVEYKLKEITSHQQTLRQLSQEKSIFSSTADQIQQKNILIKDQITEVQALNEDIQRQLDEQKQLRRQQGQASQHKSIQTCIDILNTRVMRATLEFKQFLTEHQQTVKIQEEKKGRLKGGITSATATSKNDGVRAANAKSRPMKILPGYQYSQVANNEDVEGGGAFSIQMSDANIQDRTQSIETIQKTLYDITLIFKRFATIVQEQQILVERIDANTENAMQDLEGAKGELRDAYDNSKGTRKQILKIFFILMMFTTIYVLLVL